MIINIFGSTGIIGIKTLKIIKDYFPKIQINLLVANTNYNLLIKQIKLYKPKFVYLNDKNNIVKLQKKISRSTKILSFEDLTNYLYNSKSHFTILAISGYKSLYYLEQIIFNTANLGLVSKESIVSAGHLFKKKNFLGKTNIFPLDSEHFSLFEFFKNNNDDLPNSCKITLTASGGPFYKKKFKNLDSVTFLQATNHPKWKMGYKNSIDSATLVNKCLEVIEAHYLFGISYNNIKILIHPEALVHSIVEKKNYVSHMNLFKNDMSIPIVNFFLHNTSTHNLKINKLNNLPFKQLNFLQVRDDIFPIYRFFLNLNKKNPANIIKFNTGNEYAVNLFKNKLIKYTDIYKIIKKVCSLNLYYPLNTIKDIILFHEKLEKKINKYFENKL